MCERWSSTYACRSEWASCDNGERIFIEDWPVSAFLALRACVNVVSSAVRFDKVVALGWMGDSTIPLESLFINTERPVGDDAVADELRASPAPPPPGKTFIKPIPAILSSNAPTSLIRQTSICRNMPHTTSLLASPFGTHHLLMLFTIIVISGLLSPSSNPCAAAPTSTPPPPNTAEPKSMDVSFGDKGYLPKRCFPSIAARSMRRRSTCSWTKESKLDRKLRVVRNVAMVPVGRDESAFSSMSAQVAMLVMAPSSSLLPPSLSNDARSNFHRSCSAGPLRFPTGSYLRSPPEEERATLLNVSCVNL
mmetsp:Transcript_26171/g.54658  ORF Transcript_26171/g.54658 Transcript_26171/m.54658 type:complete len:307 (-) Transcript_26171:83-1003(-)